MLSTPKMTSDRSGLCLLHLPAFFSAYLRHLFIAKEVLALRLNTIHNLYYYLSFMRELREAIRQNRLLKFREEFYRQRCDLGEARVGRTESESDPGAEAENNPRA
jgi:queuine/archaeosine tRNA-ribosyltransferase